MLLHVVDGSHPDAPAQMEAVESVLGELKQDLSEAILVFNKIDRVEDRIVLQYLRGERKQQAVHVSAHTGEGLDELEKLVRARIDQRSLLFDVLLPMSEGRFESQLRRICQPLEDDYDEARNLRRLRVRLTESALGNLRRGARPGILFEPVVPG